MHTKKHLYSFVYDDTERALSQLESKYLFGQVSENKLLLSDTTITPSSSAFIKNRLDIITASANYDALIEQVKGERIKIEGFKVEYLVIEGDSTGYAMRLGKLKDIGYSITGVPDYQNPTRTYALCCYEGIWCFGILIKNKYDWHKHKQKPHSFSNSISPNIAKALINIAAQADKSKTLLDACCGVGTIMLEAHFADYTIEGSDINWKMCHRARANLAHFDYASEVFRSDIKDISQRYDAAIIDLPYNLFSTATEADLLHIIQSTADITDRIVIVSVSDIITQITTTGLKVMDYCSVPKKGKSKFARRVWVCERA